MTFPTYKAQFDKLTRAYINNEIDAWNCRKCFIGNLLNNNANWAKGRHVIAGMELGVGCVDMDSNCLIEAKACVFNESNGLYTLQDIADLEVVFLNAYQGAGGELMAWQDRNVTQKDEDALFIAFEIALDYLKKIHILKGENVDETPVFKKRTINTSGLAKVTNEYLD